VSELRLEGRFTKRHRVKKRSDFRRIQESGRRVVSASFIFLLLRSEEANGPRIGITASRRVGNAPERNRAKRLVREAFRATRAFWPDAADVVVIVRHGLGTRKLAEVVSEWQAAQGRIARRWAELVAEARPQSEPTDSLAVNNSC
jgi:ribonuclease P protein component